MTAWTVPVVQVVAASPVFAVSGPANISGTTGTITRSDAKTFVVDIPVTNSGGSATSALNARLTWTPAGDTTIDSVTAVAGWTKVANEYRWTAIAQATATTPQPFKVTVKIKNTGNNGAVKTGGTMAVVFTEAATSATVTKSFS